MGDVFISYSRKDFSIANQVYETLTTNGISCFIDLDGISGGADFPAVLADSIMAAKLMVFIASENSYSSEFTLKELTFAVRNKGSNFILPIIVDNSKLPKSLEFILSNINWRVLSPKYRIEVEMLAEVKRLLNNPLSRVILPVQQTSQKKISRLGIVLISLFAVALLSFFAWRSVSYFADKAAANKAYADASTSLEYCNNLITEATLKLERADSWSKSGESIFSFERECECLETAEALLLKADSVANLYVPGPYSTLFSKVSTVGLKDRIDSKKDSMFVYWKKIAILNYQDYSLFPDDNTKEVAWRYVSWALRLNPGDKDMLYYKAELSK